MKYSLNETLMTGYSKNTPVSRRKWIDLDEPFNLAYPLSTCPKCKTAIKLWHNIPIISYLLLRGRCAYCDTTISLQALIIEAITALLSVFTVYLLGFSGATLYALLLLWCLIALSMIDYDTYLLPDNLTLPLLWLGLLANSWGLYRYLQRPMGSDSRLFKLMGWYSNCFV